MLLNNIQKSYGSVEELKPSRFYATLLDPRYKTAAFTVDSYADRAMQEVQYEIAELLRIKSKFK